MWFTTYVLKNLSRRPLRSLLTIFAIALAIGSVVALVGIANGFEGQFVKMYATMEVDLIVVRSGVRQRLTSNLDESLADKIRQVPGVKQVLLGLAELTSFQEYDLYSVLVQGWEPETKAFEHLKLLDTVPPGRQLRKDDTQVVLLGRVLASNMGKKVGDSVEVVEKQPFEVVGIVQSNNVFENGAIFMPIKEVQRLFDKKGKVTGFSLMLDNPRDKAAIEEVRRQVEDLMPGQLSCLPAVDHAKTISEIGAAKAMAWLTSSIALFIGFFGMVNTMLMSVHERTREIGILRAVGWHIFRVIRMILLEAVFLSVLGAITGIVAAVVSVHLLTRVRTVAGFIAPDTSLALLAEGFLIAVVLGLLGSVLPAIRATQMLPTEALRHE